MSIAVFGIENDGLNLFANLLIFFLIVLWLALVYWTYSDAQRRIDDPMLVGCATVAALFPFIGPLIYAVVRPPEYLDDARERDLEIRAAQSRLKQLERQMCPNCNYAVDATFLRCPSCMFKLKNPCDSCGKPVDPSWRTCPFCETPIAPAKTRGGGGGRIASTRTGGTRADTERTSRNELIDSEASRGYSTDRAREAGARGDSSTSEESTSESKGQSRGRGKKVAEKRARRKK